jgi:hypothetical protein
VLRITQYSKDRLQDINEKLGNKSRILGVTTATIRIELAIVVMLCSFRLVTNSSIRIKAFVLVLRTWFIFQDGSKLACCYWHDRKLEDLGEEDVSILPEGFESWPRTEKDIN